MIVPIPRDDLSFWVRTPDRLPCGPLEGDTTAEIAIVGGGFSGLSAAYHLIREHPDLDIALVESQVVGSGASGRNTGILRPGVGGTILDLVRQHGQSGARQLYQASLDAVEHVRELIRSERIECELEDTPHLKLALTARQAQLLRDEAAMLDRLGFAANWFDAARMADLAPLPSRGGLCYPQGGQLNPALLSRELKRLIIERGVRVYERSPISAVTPGKPIRLELAHGTLVARRVVLATNAHTPQLGLLCGQIIPIQTHVSVTEPVTDAQLATLSWQGRMSLSDKRHIFNYYRLTKDHRIMFGGGRPVYRAARGNRSAGATDIADPKVWSEQRRVFADSFPSLSDVTIDKQWSGTIGMTLDRFPMIAELAEAPGVFFAGGWSGHGVALASASGALIADLLSGPSTWQTTLPWHRNRAPKVPGDPVRALGLSAYLTGLELGDRLEALFDRWSPRRVPARDSCHSAVRA